MLSKNLPHETQLHRCKRIYRYISKQSRGFQAFLSVWRECREFHDQSGLKVFASKVEFVKGLTLSSIWVWMSSREKGIVESSSSKNEWEAVLVLSSINCFILARTSWLTVSVLYLSSQYIVLILYNCCTERTGHKSLVISSRDFVCFWWITRKDTACKKTFDVWYN